MTSTTTTKRCIKCHDAPRADDLHCAACALVIEREEAKLNRLMTRCEGCQGERIVLDEPPFTAVKQIARSCGWKPVSEDFRIWIRT